MSRCKHENADHVFAGDVIHWYSWNARSTTVQCEQLRCLDCGAWLSLGPSSETPECAVEIRAAELVASNDHWRRLVHSGVPGHDDEVDGYLMFFDEQRVPGNAAQWAGYLAGAILEHGEGK